MCKRASFQFVLYVIHVPGVAWSGTDSHSVAGAASSATSEGTDVGGGGGGAGKS